MTRHATKRLLLIRTDHLGDMVLMVPLLRGLRHALPEWDITLLTNADPAVTNFLEKCPYVDHLLMAPALPGGRAQRLRFVLPSWRFAVRHLRKPAFDLVILPRSGRGDFKALALAFFARGRHKLAFSSAYGQSRIARYAIDTWISPPGNTHAVLANLQVLHSLDLGHATDNLECWLTADDEVVAAGLLRNVNEKPVAIAPGANYPSKTWPFERYAAVAQSLQKNMNVHFVILGSHAERDHCEKLTKAIGRGAVNLAGLTTIRQAAAVLKDCRLLLSNDAGLVHVAATVKTPVVVVGAYPRGSGANSPDRFHPWGVPFEIICPSAPTPPCRNECNSDQPHCILANNANDVLVACLNLLNKDQSLSVPDLPEEGAAAGSEADPLITVGITACNAVDTIAAALDSALAQAWPNKEIVVVDDHSTDGTWEILEQYGETHAEIRLFRNDRNLGVGFSRNRIIHEAHGVFLAFLDDDDISSPLRLRRQYERILAFEASHPGMGRCICFVSRRQIYPDGTTVFIPAIPETAAPLRGEAVAMYLLTGAPLPVAYAAGVGTAMSRLSTFRELGGFDEKLRRYEDTEFDIRLARADGCFLGVDEPLLDQHMTLSGDKDMNAESGNWRLVIEKHQDLLAATRWLAFVRHWSAVRHHYLAGHRLKTACGLLFGIMRFPVKSILKMKWALRNRESHRTLRRLHQGKEDSQ
jgi:ADP-heptose:LPS heptosyltransferase/glycosyltransferase involved in cell wall biosynthesis